MGITHIIVEIWEHLSLLISLKIAKLHYKHYFYVCIVEDVALSHHPTKFGNNCKTQCGNISKTVKNLLSGGHKQTSLRSVNTFCFRQNISQYCPTKELIL